MQMNTTRRRRLRFLALIIPLALGAVAADSFLSSFEIGELRAAADASAISAIQIARSAELSEIGPTAQLVFRSFSTESLWAKIAIQVDRTRPAVVVSVCDTLLTRAMNPNCDPAGIVTTTATGVIERDSEWLVLGSPSSL